MAGRCAAARRRYASDPCSLPLEPSPRRAPPCGAAVRGRRGLQILRDRDRRQGADLLSLRHCHQRAAAPPPAPTQGRSRRPAAHAGPGCACAARAVHGAGGPVSWRPKCGTPWSRWPWSSWCGACAPVGDEPGLFRSAGVMRSKLNGSDFHPCLSPDSTSPTPSANARSPSTSPASRLAARDRTTSAWPAARCLATTPRSWPRVRSSPCSTAAPATGRFVNGETVTERRAGPWRPHPAGARRRRGDGVPRRRGALDPGRTRPRLSAIGDLRHVAALLEGLRALGSGRVLDEVLALVLDSALNVGGAERGFIMLADPEGKLEFKLARARGRITLPGRGFETSRKIPEEVFATGEARMIADLLDGDLAAVHTGTVALGIRNVLCVPLRLVRYLEKADAAADDQPDRRAVSRQRARRARCTSSSTRSALETLATEAAVAIENARLYRETLEKARLDQEMRIAAVIQQALLPKGSTSASTSTSPRQRCPAGPSAGTSSTTWTGRRAVRLRARRRGRQGPPGGAAERPRPGHPHRARTNQPGAGGDGVPRQRGPVPARHRVALRDDVLRPPGRAGTA